MKLPEKPPNWSSLLQKHLKKLNVIFGGISPLKEAVHIASQANYLYWEKVKHFAPLPKGFDSEMLWLSVKFTRAGAKAVPLSDLQGKPFVFNEPEVIRTAIHEIDRNIPLLVNDVFPEDGGVGFRHFQMEAMNTEAIASSQMEGAKTPTETAQEMLRTGRKPKDKSERMIRNNRNAMELIKQVRHKKLTKNLLLELHVTMTDGTMDEGQTPGAFRKGPISVIDVLDGTEIYKAPPHGLLDERVQKLINFANEDHCRRENFIHPVIKAIILHFWLAYEHPFEDGNGRVARALFYWFMLKNKYWQFELLSISETFKSAPSRYPRAFLYTEYDDNDLTYFVNFNTHKILESLDQLAEHAKHWKKERESVNELLKRLPLNERQLDILAQAIDKPNEVFTIALHKKKLGIVYETARRDLVELTTMKFLVMVQRGKKYIFYPATNLKVLLADVVKKVEF